MFGEKPLASTSQNRGRLILLAKQQNKVLSGELFEIADLILIFDGTRWKPKLLGDIVKL